MKYSDLFYETVDNAILGEDITSLAESEDESDVGVLAVELSIDDIEHLETLAEESGQDVLEFARDVLVTYAHHHSVILGEATFTQGAAAPTGTSQPVSTSSTSLTPSTFSWGALVAS